MNTKQDIGYKNSTFNNTLYRKTRHWSKGALECISR